MAEEKDKIMPDEDQGVKIEIHGEDNPKAEESETPEEADAGENDPEEKPAEADQQDSKAEDDKTGQAESDIAEDDKTGQAEPEKAEEDQGDEKASGKGFFGFKNKKDKKDEKIEQLTDQVARQLAEFDNYRKRTDREKAAMFDMGKRDAIEKILPVVDNFERGLGDMEKEDDDPFRQGMIKIYRQLMKVLGDMGVKAIEAEGKPFDPDFHNAVMHCEDDSVGENIVVQDLQKGYMMNDTVIRHSMVKVAN